MSKRLARTALGGRGAVRITIALGFALGFALAPGLQAQEQPAPGDSTARTEEERPIFARLNLDRLRLRGLSLVVGGAKPSQMVTTQLYGIEADYGEILPRWRVVFSTVFWASHFNEATVRRYRDQLASVVTDPSGDDVVDVGRIRVSDIALSVDARWSPSRNRSTFLRPYLGGAVVAHVLNAEGRAIENTLVERALDNIVAAPAILVGVDAVLFRQVSVGMQARYDVVNAARFGSVRAVGTYFFDHRPAPAAPAGGR